MIKAVFLDIDDTLLSFSGYVRQSMREGFAHYGLPAYEESMYAVFEGINDGLWKQLERGEIDFDQLVAVRWNLIFRELGFDFDGPTFERYFRKQLFWSAVPEPGAPELVDYLSGRYLLCAASNGPFEQQVNRLKVAGMYRSFAHVLISSQVGAQKPEAAFFDHCFEELHRDLPGLRPEETVLVGDSMTSDIAGGAAYGMHTILFQKVPGDRPVGRYVPEHVVHKLQDVQRYL